MVGKAPWVRFDDLSRWARADGLEILLLAVGATLAGRFIRWGAGRLADRMQEAVSAANRAGLPAGELVVIPNGEIRQVTNRSRDWSRVAVDVPVELDADLDRAVAVLRDVGSDMASDEAWSGLLLEPPTAVGVESIEAGHANVRVVARTLPARATEVGRELRRRAILALQSAGLSARAT